MVKRRSENRNERQLVTSSESVDTDYDEPIETLSAKNTVQGGEVQIDAVETQSANHETKQIWAKLSAMNLPADRREVRHLFFKLGEKGRRPDLIKLVQQWLKDERLDDVTKVYLADAIARVAAGLSEAKEALPIDSGVWKAIVAMVASFLKDEFVRGDKHPENVMTAIQALARIPIPMGDIDVLLLELEIAEILGVKPEIQIERRDGISNAVNHRKQKGLWRYEPSNPCDSNNDLTNSLKLLESASLHSRDLMLPVHQHREQVFIDEQNVNVLTQELALLRVQLTQSQMEHAKAEQIVKQQEVEIELLRTKLAQLMRPESQPSAIPSEIEAVLSLQLPSLLKAGGFTAWLKQLAEITVLDEQTVDVARILQLLGERAKFQNQSVVTAANQLLQALQQKKVNLARGKLLVDGLVHFEKATGCPLTDDRGSIHLSPRQDKGYSFARFSVIQRDVPRSERSITTVMHFLKCRFQWTSTVTDSSEKSEKMPSSE